MNNLWSLLTFPSASLRQFISCHDMRWIFLHLVQVRSWRWLVQMVQIMAHLVLTWYYPEPETGSQLRPSQRTGGRQWSITRAEHQETSNFYFPPQKYLIKTFDPETSVILHTVTPPLTIFQSKLLTKVHKKYFNLHIEHEHQTIVNSLKIYKSNYDPFYNITENLHTNFEFKCQSC